MKDVLDVEVVRASTTCQHPAPDQGSYRFASGRSAASLPVSGLQYYWLFIKKREIKGVKFKSESVGKHSTCSGIAINTHIIHG